MREGKKVYLCGCSDHVLVLDFSLGCNPPDMEAWPPEVIFAIEPVGPWHVPLWDRIKDAWSMLRTGHVPRRCTEIILNPMEILEIMESFNKWHTAVKEDNAKDNPS